jgi:hypothetical protein
MSADELVLLIENSFRNTPYPGDDNMVSPVVVGGVELRDPEREEVAVILRGKTWRRLSKKNLARLRQELPSLSPAAFRYYLPAFMLAAVRDQEWDSFPLVYSLTLPSPAEGKQVREWMLARFSALTHEEHGAVSAFLKYLMDDLKMRDDAAIALASYWSVNE